MLTFLYLMVCFLYELALEIISRLLLAHQKKTEVFLFHSGGLKEQALTVFP